MIVKTTKESGVAGLLGYLLDTKTAPLVIRHTNGNASHVHIVFDGKAITQRIGDAKK